MLWQIKPEKSFLQAIKNFDENCFRTLMSTARMTRDSEQYWTDPGRILITEEEEQIFADLQPLWKQREILSRIFNDVFQTDQIKTLKLLVTDPSQDTTDQVFHRDWASGDRAAEELFMITSHTHQGSEAIPSIDSGAGRDALDNIAARQFFDRPESLKNISQVNQHDILIFKTGPKGLVHRAPEITDGRLRWLSFFFADAQNLKSIRNDFTQKELNCLRRSLA